MQEIGKKLRVVGSNGTLTVNGLRGMGLHLDTCLQTNVVVFAEIQMDAKPLIGWQMMVFAACIMEQAIPGSPAETCVATGNSGRFE